MLRISTILLAFLILVQSMRGIFVYTSLKLNQDEIAEKYCENTNITTCYGSCYIDKQLKNIETEDSQKQSTTTVKVSIIDIFYKNLTYFEFCSNGNSGVKKIAINFCNPATKDYIFRLLRPPQLEIHLC